jgi:hypothetical protein
VGSLYVRLDPWSLPGQQTINNTGSRHGAGAGRDDKEHNSATRDTAVIERIAAHAFETWWKEEEWAASFNRSGEDEQKDLARLDRPEIRRRYIAAFTHAYLNVLGPEPQPESVRITQVTHFSDGHSYEIELRDPKHLREHVRAEIFIREGEEEDPELPE